MKAISHAILIVCAAASIGTAAPVTIAWDDQPGVEKWRVWRGLALLTTVTTNIATIDLPADQTSALTVTAMIGISESDPSAIFDLLPVTVEYSEDLVIWRPMTYFVERKPKMFFRRLTFPEP